MDEAFIVFQMFENHEFIHQFITFSEPDAIMAVEILSREDHKSMFSYEKVRVFKHEH